MTGKQKAEAVEDALTFEEDTHWGLVYATCDHSRQISWQRLTTMLEFLTCRSCARQLLEQPELRAAQAGIFPAQRLKQLKHLRKLAGQD